MKCKKAAIRSDYQRTDNIQQKPQAVAAKGANAVQPRKPTPPKNKDLSQEQVNRIMRQHKIMKTLTIEEIVVEVDKLANDFGYATNLPLLFNSIKTHKSVEQLKRLLDNPRPDVNEHARSLAKISFFSKKANALGLKVINPLEEAAKKTTLTEFEGQKLFNYCAENNKFKEFYMLYHKLQDFQFERNIVHNRKSVESIFDLVKQDFKIYNQNAKECAFNDAVPNIEVIDRLKFALQFMNAEKVNEIAKEHILEHHLLFPRFNGTVFEVVNAFYLCVNGKITADNWKKTDKIVSVQLQKKGILSQFSLDYQENDISENNLTHIILQKLQTFSTINQFPFEQIDEKIITQQMLEYHSKRTFQTYPERYQFLQKWSQEHTSKFTTEPVTALNDHNISYIQLYRKYLAQVKTYQTQQQNPCLAVMQTKVVEEFFESYPLTEEPIQFDFEKILFNKKDRYFNGERRLQSMRALLLAPFIHAQPKAISKVMRYIAAAAQTTSNSTEKAAIIQVLDPLSVFEYILEAKQQGLFDINLVDMAKEVADVFFKYPDALARYLQTFNSELPSFLFNLVFKYFKGEEVPTMFEQVIRALIAIRTLIPTIVYNNNVNVVVRLNNDVWELERFDMVNIYETEKGATNSAAINKLYKQHKDAMDFRNNIISRFEKVFEYQYNYFESLISQLQKTQTFFIQCQEKVSKAKKEELEGLVFEKLYVELYISAFQKMKLSCFFPQNVSYSKITEVGKTQEEKNYIQLCNDILSTYIYDEITIHKQSICALQSICNQVMLHSNNFSVQSFGISDIRFSINSVAALRFFKVITQIITYMKQQYLTKYDEKRLSSEFVITQVENIHKDILCLYGQIIIYLSRQQDRHQKIKNLTVAMCQNVKLLEECNNNLLEAYQMYYTTKFARKTKQPVQRQKKRAPAAAVSQLATQLDVVTYGLNIVLKNLPPHQMIDIVGDLMSITQFAPLGVYCVTHLQHVIKYDSKASLDDLFTKQMPMSSLKTLIKFMFKSHEVDFDKILNLFRKSSVDGRVCIMEHFYLRATEEVQFKEMFLQLVKQTCQRNPDVFLLFFGNYYQEEEQHEFNCQILDAVKPIIETDKMSPYMLNFAGYLNKKYEISFVQAIQAFETISQQEKACRFCIVYLLRNYQDKLNEISASVCSKLTGLKNYQNTVVYQALCEVVETENEELDHKVQFQAIELYISVLSYFTKVPTKIDLDLLTKLHLVSPAQLDFLVPLLISFNYLNYDSSAQDWLLYDVQRMNTQFGQAFVHIYTNKGLQPELINNLSFLENILLQKVAKDTRSRFYAKVHGEEESENQNCRNGRGPRLPRRERAPRNERNECEECENCDDDCEYENDDEYENDCEEYESDNFTESESEGYRPRRARNVDDACDLQIQNQYEEREQRAPRRNRREYEQNCCEEQEYQQMNECEQNDDWGQEIEQNDSKLDDLFGGF
ncbi:Conserved_hypothetical protein [Hexamita inflata]|uniref:Uncharacterized protein n=1 Tax=Hexamita inflata TaxID=28002 RepID=A0AA86R6S4_9EUKA|nr:Conserved hypothetical protein [Hexamita inflata]